ncbi:MAG: hypothetical protein U0324_46745 [Polyangiales bacterium]
MQEVVTRVRAMVVQTLERVRDAESDLVLSEGTRFTHNQRSTDNACHP